MGRKTNGFFGAGLARRLGFQARDKPAARTYAVEQAPPGLAAYVVGGGGARELMGSEGVCAAVTRLANAFGSMPVHLYRGNRVQEGHPLEALMAFAPNANMTPFMFRYALMASLGIYGVAYALIVPDGRGCVESLDVLNPQRVQPAKNSETGETWYTISLDDGSMAYVHTSSMLVMLWASTDGLTSFSPIEALGATLKYDRSVQEISLRKLEGVNGAVTLTYPTTLSEDRKRAIEAQFLGAYRKSYGQVIVLEGGVTADRIAGSVIDSGALNCDAITKSKIASVYNLPPRLIGAQVNSDYSTSEQAVREFMTLTMLPRVVDFEDQLRRKLLRKDLWAQGYEFKMNMDAMLRGDVASVAEKNSKAVRSGTTTPNEVRRENNLPPLPNGDELMIARDLIPLRIAVEHPEMLLGVNPNNNE